MLHRRRTIDVERSHQHVALVALGQAPRELCGGGGLAGALQADHHDRDRRHRVEVDGLALGAERCDQFVMDDLDHHLAGRDRLDHGGADRLLADLLGKGTHHVERDVGLQQRAAHLAHRRIDVGLAERAAPRQPVQNAAKLFRQVVEHRFKPKNGLSVKGLCKQFCARGRTALSGVDLQPQGPVGGSKRTSFRGWG